MQKIIAVILDENNTLTQMQEAQKIFVFQKTEQKWAKKREVLIPEIYQGSMAEIRKNLESVIKELDGCKIIVGKSITGLVYNIFNNAGFIISEADDFNETILDGLYSDIQKEADALNTEKALNNIPTSPVETEIKGNYFFDFSLLKNSTLPYSSKETILPFLNSVRFNRLEILCDHVMPWFDSEMKKRNLLYTVTEEGKGKCRILVKPVDVTKNATIC